MTMPSNGQLTSAAEPVGRTPAPLLLRPWHAVVALAGIVATAWAIYRPDVRRPFDFIDFPESLLILQAHDSFLGQVTGLATAFLAQARFNLIVYLTIAAQWSAFGWWTPGWQLTRFATMAIVVVLAYRLLRRLQMSVVGALAGATIFVVVPSAARGWIRLTSAEPIVAMFVLTAALLATYYPASRRKFAIGVALAVLGVLVVLTKEILAVAFVLPLYLLVTVRPTGLLESPRIDRSNRAVLAGVVAAMAVALIPSVWAFLHAPVSSYGRGFGAASLSLFELLGMSLAGLIPFVPAPGALGMLVVNAGYWGLLFAGLPLTLLQQNVRRHTGWLLLLAILLPVLCGVVYLPWPSFQVVYAVPFLFGESLLVAIAVTNVEHRGKLPAACAIIAWCMVLVYAIPEAVSNARRFDTIQVVTGELLEKLSAARGVDSVLVVGPETVYDQRALFGPRLSIYAKARGLSIPPTRDISCEAGERAASASRVLVVWSTLMCGGAPMQGDAIRRLYPRLDWTALRLVYDSTRLDILGGR